MKCLVRHRWPLQWLRKMNDRRLTINFYVSRQATLLIAPRFYCFRLADACFAFDQDHSASPETKIEGVIDLPGRFRVSQDGVGPGVAMRSELLQRTQEIVNVPNAAVAVSTTNAIQLNAGSTQSRMSCSCSSSAAVQILRRKVSRAKKSGACLAIGIQSLASDASSPAG